MGLVSRMIVRTKVNAVLYARAIYSRTIMFCAHEVHQRSYNKMVYCIALIFGGGLELVVHDHSAKIYSQSANLSSAKMFLSSNLPKLLPPIFCYAV